jgi:hypothetical protein
MTDLVKLYNPANAAGLTPDQVAGLQKLTDGELKELAKAYPNVTMQRAYLLIIDTRKSPDKQLPTLSSFENLYNLRTKNNMKSYVAYNFKGYKAPNKLVTNKGKSVKKKVEVLDLSDAELLTLPGFKSIPIASVPVKKVGKSVKKEIVDGLVDEMKKGVEVLSQETKTQ